MPKILSIDMTSVAKPDCVPSTKPDYIPSSKFGSANELFKVSTKKLVAPVKVSKKNLSLPSSKRSAKPRQPFVRKQAILNALARLKGGGAVAPPKDTVGLVAGCFPMEQPSFDKAIREMINKGWLTTTSTGLMLTAAGEAKVPTHITLDPVLSNHEILSAVEESLTPKKKGIFQLLSNGFEYLREDVAEAVGYKAETVMLDAHCELAFQNACCSPRKASHAVCVIRLPNYRSRGSTRCCRRWLDRELLNPLIAKSAQPSDSGAHSFLSDAIKFTPSVPR
jgi:hypothetical protein